MLSQPAVHGQVMTVLGPIDGSALGITLTHEHVMKDSSDRVPPPAEVSRRAHRDEPLTLANLHCVTYGNFFDILDNTRLTDEALAVAELGKLRAAGGDSICELTCEGMNGDPQALARISRATGINIVMGCGYYVERSHPPHVATMSEAELAEGLVRDLRVGVAGTKVRAGVIGEIGCSWPLGTHERKVLRAAVRAQRETGVALSIHPSPNERSPAQIIDVLTDAGAQFDRTVICHMDRCGYSLETRLAILETGCFIEYDTFGYHVHPIAAAVREGALPGMLNDVARVKQIAELIELGYIGQLLVSHDTAFKHALTSYGGQGYGHLLRNVVPYMELYGLTEAHLHTLFVDNPRRLLTVR